ncbi:hypothetical protein ACLOJK_018668, partial [Asimina triloba]
MEGARPRCCCESWPVAARYFAVPLPRCAAQLEMIWGQPWLRQHGCRQFGGRSTPPWRREEDLAIDLDGGLAAARCRRLSPSGKKILPAAIIAGLGKKVEHQNSVLRWCATF